jgi:hypothetical protein
MRSTVRSEAAFEVTASCYELQRVIQATGARQKQRFQFNIAAFHVKTSHADSELALQSQLSVASSGSQVYVISRGGDNAVKYNEECHR